MNDANNQLNHPMRSLTSLKDDNSEQKLRHKKYDGDH
jgi:hypothetical protein